MSELPAFPYHPDPIATGAVVASEKSCACCGRVRGYICAEPPFIEEELPEEAGICPWCVADGSAAERLGCAFVSHCSNFADGCPCSLEKRVQTELYERTPGFESWQGPSWLCHCGEPCEFHGEMTAERLVAVPDDAFDRSATANPLLDVWRDSRHEYRRASDIAIYEFRCRRCGVVLLDADAC